MLRTFLIAALLTALAAAPAHAAERSLLAPGVTYERQVQFTSHGPVAVHVLRAPKPGGLWSLRPVLSNGAIVGRERVTAMQRELSAAATVAGVNGDFAAADGRPSGIVVRGSVLDRQPHPDRSSIGITSDGRLRIERVRMFGTWRGTGQRRPLTLNEPPGPNGVALLTPTWGPVTPPGEGTVEAVLNEIPPTRPNVELGATVAHAAPSAGGTAIPAGGGVLVARGTAAQRLLEEAPPGTGVTLRFLLSPDWSGVADALGGGPALVRDGKPLFRHGELFSPALLGRDARTAVGQLADGRLLLVVVDGRRRGYSSGLTSFELAQTMVRLGAVTASGLESGGSATMAFEGALLNRPADPGGERPVAQGLFVVYEGVHAPPPSVPVVSPNGDGVADVQGLTYKLVRPSTVNVRLLGPRGIVRELDSGEKPAGVHRFSWNGTGPDGVREPDGAWRFSVTAADELGRSSRADRRFTLDRTQRPRSVARQAPR